MEHFLDSFQRPMLLALVAGAALPGTTVGQPPNEPISRLEVAQYTASDELIYPADTALWVVVGATIGGEYSDAAFDPSNPGNIGIVQMEPTAYRYLRANRRYADGTMFLLSFYETQEKPEPALPGFVQGDAVAREIHVIDRSRYEDNRGFYFFSAEGGGTSPMLPAGNECVQCHSEHGDFDSTFTQFYPPIRDLLSDSPPSGSERR